VVGGHLCRSGIAGAHTAELVAGLCRRVALQAGSSTLPQACRAGRSARAGCQRLTERLRIQPSGSSTGGFGLAVGLAVAIRRSTVDKKTPRPEQALMPAAPISAQQFHDRCRAGHDAAEHAGQAGPQTFGSSPSLKKGGVCGSTPAHEAPVQATGFEDLVRGELLTLATGASFLVGLPLRPGHLRRRNGRNKTSIFFESKMFSY